MEDDLAWPMVGSEAIAAPGKQDVRVRCNSCDRYNMGHQG